jgi:organic radical activating enzyme
MCINIKKAKVSEIFKSIQGEGIYQGVFQVFVRFFGCNLNCTFCDTRLNFYQEFDLDTLLKRIFSYTDYYSISLTGGEPLLQIDFLRELVKILKKKNKLIYLETNGTLPSHLEEIIDFLDIISMDFKLPSSTQGDSFWERHRRFLKIALKKEVFVKAVICKNTTLEDIKKSLSLLKEMKREIYFILQPNFFQNDEELKKKMSYFLSFCKKEYKKVEIRKQLHKIIFCK